MKKRVDKRARGPLFASTMLLGMGVALAAPGDLDPSFGGEGLLSVHIGDFAYTTSIIQQSDGRLVFAGHGRTGNFGSDDFVAVRVAADGTPDSAFGINGIARADFFARSDGALAAIQQDDGKVVLAGYAIRRNGDTDIALARFNTDGNLDPTFDGDGKATLDIGGTKEHAVGLALQPSGKLVVAGQSNAGGTNRAFFARFDVTGTLDATFGNSGLAFADLGRGLAFRVNDLAQQADGALVVAGAADGADKSQMGLARVTVDGALDSSFDGDGLLFMDLEGRLAEATSIAIQSDGSIVIAGSQLLSDETAAVVLLRIRADGNPDTSFGTGGRAIIDLGKSGALYSIAVQADGRLVATGLIQGDGSDLEGDGSDLVVARFSSDGVLDATHGIDGVAIADFGRYDRLSSASGVALIQTTDGKLVAAGNRYDGGFSGARFSNHATAPGVIGLITTSMTVTEEDAKVSYVVRRTGGNSGAVSVNYATSAGTALPGSDFESASGTLTWTDGDVDDKTIAINLIDDSDPEGQETFLLSLSSPTGGAVLAASEATTLIRNADGPGELGFSLQIFGLSAISGSEGESDRVPVGRFGGSEGSVSVSYNIINSGNATLGEDFVTSGTLAWADGDTGQKFIRVEYLEDTVFEGDESFRFELTTPTGGATIRSSLRLQPIVIIDNEAGFRLSHSAISIIESGGTLQIMVGKHDVLKRTASVDFATSNGTAVAGSDYSAASGTLTWAAGDSEPKTIEIPITNDQGDENNESFTVSLSNPTGGFALGPNSTATVTIADDDLPPPPPPPPPRGGGGTTGLELLALLGLLQLFGSRVRQIRWLETQPGVL